MFANDATPLKWLNAASLQEAGLSNEERRLYADFAVRRGDQLGCPANFNLLSLGWYLNEPPDGYAANIIATADYRMIARRDIAQGEELTVSYETFSDRRPFP